MFYKCVAIVFATNSLYRISLGTFGLESAAVYIQMHWASAIVDFWNARTTADRRTQHFMLTSYEGGYRQSNHG